MSACTILSLALAALSAAAPVAATARDAQAQNLPIQRFQTGPVTPVEVGDFHFQPGQMAPKHTRVAPVFGYVSKGAIVYQIEGPEPVILETSDVFYEPGGPNILHFDNASKTEEAVFTDFNFERDGEPF